MRKKTWIALCALATAAILASALALVSCASKGERPGGKAPDGDSSATAGLPLRLAPGEVSEYHGEHLDPASSIPEVSIKGPIEVDIASYRLVVDGLVMRSLSLRYAEALALPQAEKVITLHCVEGWTATALWSGPLLEAIIGAAGPLPAADTVIFTSVDGYSTSLPLADILQRHLILASRINGIDLPAARGFPFMVAAEDKWGYKWARWVIGIRLSDDPSYKGTWEEEGYNINGDEGGPRWESPPPLPERGAQ
jgi:DMSO/TMAO reductase YedYZ molybdopterin-dependent catalytic subunit